MVPFDSLGTVSYLHSTATMVVSLVISEITYSASKNGLTLKSSLGVVQGHRK